MAQHTPARSLAYKEGREAWTRRNAHKGLNPYNPFSRSAREWLAGFTSWSSASVEA